MNQLCSSVWLVDGESVRFFTLPFSTRMTVIRLANGDLWVHSPVCLTDPLRDAIDALGPVRWLIAPNHLHHLFVADWQQAWPNAALWGTREVQEKRPDLRFDGTLGEGEPPWLAEIDQLLFTGSPAMTECVFLHKASRTLIVADLIENFHPDQLGWLQRPLAKAAGVVSPNGGMPIDWRFSFRGHHDQARAHIEHILAWQPERIVMAHGVLIESNADAFLRRSFRWLRPGPASKSAQEKS